MAIGVVSASRQEDSLAIEVCPCFHQGCRCQAPGGHEVFRFRALPPDERGEAQWAAACAREALRLGAARQKASQPARLPSLEGMTL